MHGIGLWQVQERRGREEPLWCKTQMVTGAAKEKGTLYVLRVKKRKYHLDRVSNWYTLFCHSRTVIQNSKLKPLL